MSGSPPDVVLVAPYPKIGVRHGGSSGVASYTVNLAHALDDAGARVAVVAPVEPGEPSAADDGGVTIRRLFPRGPRALPIALAAARAARAPVVHLQHELFLYGGPSALPGLIASLRRPRLCRSRTVVTMHQVVDPAGVDASFTRLHRMAMPPTAARMAIAGVQRAINAQADAVVVHEPNFARLLPGAIPIPHGVEVAAPIDRATARTALGLDDRLVALCFGFVAPYKGLETAIEAARIVGAQRAQLVIAGGAHPRLEARHLYADLLRRSAGDVARFTGYLDDAQVTQWFSAADVVVLPYPKPHASSGALALALAHGRPVLASTALARTCGLPPETAFRSPAHLAEKLVELAGSVGARSRLASFTAPLVHDRGWAEVARRHLRDAYRLGACVA